MPGLPPTGTVNFSIYGPNDATCSGTPSFVSFARPLTAGVATSASYTPASPGTYRVIAVYNGDPNYVPVSGACNAPNEQVVVNQPPPVIATQASTDFPFNPLTDTATLTGLVGPVSGTVTFRLYGPNDAACASPPIFTSTNPLTPTGPGTGSATSGGFTPPGPGIYRWRAFYSGDVNNVPVSGACNDANENVAVLGPAAPPAPPHSDTSTRGDFNGDGIGDVAIGVPGEDVGSVVDAGAVHVLYGSNGGVTSAGSQLWTQNSTGIVDLSETGDAFGPR